MAGRHLILIRDESVPPPNKQEQEIASALNRALFDHEAPAHVLIMNANRNATGMIMAVTHQNTIAAMALIYRDIIKTKEHTVDEEVIDFEANESWERLTVHTVPLVRYM